MPKLKTKKSVLKRFKITKTGKVMRGHHGSRHRMFHKSKKRIRKFAEPIALNLRQSKIVKALINR
jgi:large subunit ribosomal protein L35